MGEYVAEDAVPRDDGRSFARARGNGFLAILREVTIVVGLSLIIATLVRIFLVQAFLIPSQSMQDTLQVGDRVLVSKLTMRFGEIERGDVVVFADPGGWLAQRADNSEGVAGLFRDALQFVGVLPEDSEGHLIKRVVALGGDTVACCNAQDQVTVNGVAIDESAYLYPGDAPSATDFEHVVPDGHLFVMGDHRSNSGDSRVNDFVPVDDVVGEAFAIAWPLSRWDGLPGNDAFAQVPER